MSQNENLSWPTVAVGSAKARTCVVGRGGQKRRSAGQEAAARSSPQQPARRPEKPVMGWGVGLSGGVQNRDWLLGIPLFWSGAFKAIENTVYRTVRT